MTENDQELILIKQQLAGFRRLISTLEKEGFDVSKLSQLRQQAASIQQQIDSKRTVIVDGDVSTGGGDFIGGNKNSIFMGGININLLLEAPRLLASPLSLLELLPHDIPYFVGRSDAMDQLESLLVSRQRAAISCIVGMGGIGKSTLAIHFAAAHREAFENGILYASLREQEPLAVLANFAAAFGVDISLYPDLSARAAVVRSILAGKRVLIIMDNAENIESTREVLACLGDFNVALVTTRDAELAATVAAGPIIDMATFSEEESLNLLRLIVGKEIVNSGIRSAKSVIKYLGFLPLAVEIAGKLARLRRWEMKELRTRLRQSRERLGVLRIKDLEVRSSFELSFDALTQNRKRLFATLGVFRGFSFDKDAARYIMNVDQVEAVLNELSDHSLLWQEAQGRFRQHLLLSEFALEKLQDLDSTQEAFSRHAEYYLKVAQKEGERMENVNTLAQARRVIEQEFVQMQLGQTWGMETENYEMVIKYCLAIQMYLGLVGPYRDSIKWGKNWSSAAKNLGRRDWEYMAESYLGQTYQFLGDINKATKHFEAALGLAEITSYQEGKGSSLGNLGLAYTHLGQMDVAIKYYEMALTIARETGDSEKEGIHLNNLGLAYADLGQMEMAIQCSKQALAIANQIGNRQLKENCLGVLGMAYADLGMANEAIKNNSEALDIAKDIGDRRGEAIHTARLGQAHADLGELDISIELFNAAIKIFKEVGDLRGVGTQLNNLGLTYMELGDFRAAVKPYEQAVQIFREIALRWREGTGLGNLGLAYYLSGEISQARLVWNESSQILEEYPEMLNTTYTLAGVALGIAISDPNWNDPEQQKEIILPVIKACRAALKLSSSTGIIKEFLRMHVYPFQVIGVIGLEPIISLLESGQSDAK